MKIKGKEKKRIKELIKNINSLIKFCDNENTFLVHFTENFWKYVLNYYKDAKQENIKNCFDLRKAFKKYYELVEKMFGKSEKKDKHHLIYKDAKNYFLRDEFAFLLDQIIRKCNENSEVEPIEKLRFITQYNPYYIEEKYLKSKVDVDIFDSFDLNKIDDEFIKHFRENNFENIFKEYIYEYIKKFIDKIKNIPNLDTVIKLINVNNLKEKRIFLDSLNKSYDNIISKELEFLSNSKKLKEAYRIIAKLAIINYAAAYGGSSETRGKNVYEQKDKTLETKGKKFERDKKFDFINKRIKELDNKLSTNISPLILIEIINILFNKENKNDKEDIGEDNEDNDNKKNKGIEEEYEDIDFNDMKEFIFSEFSNKLDNENDIDNIIKLIDCLKGKDKTKEDDIDTKKKEKEEMVNEFLTKLISKKLFTKDEFFQNSKTQNLKISLLCKLYEKEIIQNDGGEYYDKIKELLDDINKDIGGEIKKSKLDEFLKNKEPIIKQRLSLINKIIESFDPDLIYEDLKKTNTKINKDIEQLHKIRDNIIIYLKESYKEIINEITDVIKNNKNKKIKDYKGGRIGDLIQRTEKENEDGESLNKLADRISKVKNLLLFNVIYTETFEKNENKRFDIAFIKLNKIKEDYLKDKTNDNDIVKLNNDYKPTFKKIKEKLKKNDKEANNFIEEFKKYYDIKVEGKDISEDIKNKNKKLIDDLTVLFKSEKYALDIKSIIFFFENYFEKDNNDWNKNLPEVGFEKEWEEDFEKISKDLKTLKENHLYDYKEIGNYNKLFTCLYEKKEAIDFLFSHNKDEILKLKDRIQPTDRTIDIKDIKDTADCVSAITKMKELKNNFAIFQYIKNMDEEEISQFVNYSKIFSSVIELDTNDDFSDNVYDRVVNIITKATFIISQDTENFMYHDKEKSEDNDPKKDMENLVNIKNQIHIKKEKDNKVDEDDIIKYKCKVLIEYKNVISNLEVIIEYMRVLRTKGSSLPIKITLDISLNVEKKELPKVEYWLGKEKREYEEIRDFLFTVKNAYISQLNSIYRENQNIRLLYGKQFRSLMKHLENNFKIDSFLRYIVNNTDNNKPIKEGYKAVNRTVKLENYIKYYDSVNKDSLDSISAYIISLFEYNGKTFGEHYKEMKIISKEKGIYLHGCENKSMEEYIIHLFYNKTVGLPIAQNVLIANKETSSEEIQAFFHRAILCNYNNLFVVEINDSFSEIQQSIMYNYIDNLLSSKYNTYKEKNKEDKIKKKNTEKYLDSYIVFIYNKLNKNITSFLKEIKKFVCLEEEEQQLNKKGSKANIKFDTKNKIIDFLDKNFQNILVITSDICGLGKSEEIRKRIKENKKTYFHFPLGGILNKSTIFDKLEKLLDKINEEINKNNKKYDDIAIHLDLTESQETSIINEFFFSFLITKFYSNNENIIYIPKDIHIYIEIPNCFDDYLSKFGLLSIFKEENITFENMPPFNYPTEIIKLFTNMLEKKSNKEIQEFVKKYIGVQKYSYHQINIFIKLFISQYSKFNTKLEFWSGDKDVTEECIQDFANCTKYFTNGGFSRLLTGTEINDEKDYIDKLSNIYDNDLRNMKFPEPLIFIVKEEMIYHKLKVPEKDSKEYSSSAAYLKRFIEILNLPYTKEKLMTIIEEKNNNYVITNDNFKKMVLLVYRIIANVPVIIMGDTGCGKTSLITKLNQILNGGKTTLYIINIHPGYDDEKLCKKMDKANDEAKKVKTEQGKELWVFFDEINTCLSLSLLTEIFINRTYNGKKLEDNIRLIGACNPYRKRKGNKEKCGLSRSDDIDNELVYLVQPLPQSLLYYVFSFGAIDEIDEKKYIRSIIQKLFTKEEKYLHEMTTEAISQCHVYLRTKYDPSVVSLREIARFSKCIDFFQNYFTIKNNHLKRDDEKKNNKIRSIICSIYLCYYIRLTNKETRENFEAVLRPILLKLVTGETNIDVKGNNLMEQIKSNKVFYNEINNRPIEEIYKFSDFLKIEQDFLIDQIELDKGIGKNALLKENVFLLFLSIITNIPLIIIGKPGTGKSLSAQLIYKSMRGKYSKNEFFRNFPQIVQIYFQGSESTRPEDVESLFEKAKNKFKSFKEKKKEKKKEEELPIIMVLFDELGLAERSESNPLKVLHEKLEYSGKDEGVSFVGISNYTLDAAKINRALVLSVPDLDQNLDDLIETSKNIVESIFDRLKEEKIFEIVSRTYFSYKIELQIIKELVVYKIYENYRTKIKENEKKNINDFIPKKPGSENGTITDDNVDDDDRDKSGHKKKGEEEEEKRAFAEIKKTKDFIDIFKKENKIKKDFHGNRDFYNLIRGIAIELRESGDSTDSEKSNIATKYIERNFGGIDYEIDIDLEATLEDIKKDIDLIKSILLGYASSDEKRRKKEKSIIKLSSVFLFKKLYNIACEKDDPNSNLKIKEQNINDYNLNNCINNNIRDTNSRYLLLEIKPSLTTLIFENIKKQNSKDTILYDGSPFVDDNNNEYRFKIINLIQDDAKEDKLILLENLNQIHPFLFDLYNMNYIINNDKKFVRISLENFNDQLTLVNEKFRVIVLIDRRTVQHCELAFLNRFEKMILSFDKLLSDELKRISKNLIEDIKLEKTINNYNNDNNNINYVLKDLLINCGDEEIQSLLYYFSNEAKKNDNDDNEEEKEIKIDEKTLRENVIGKIYKILPQDIICILPDNNIIKQKYRSENTIFSNLIDYINYIKYMNKEENIKYKISIIYTYSGIANIVEGLNKGMSINVAQIRSENALKNVINDIKKKNEYTKLEKEYNIYIDFDQSNTKKMKFISNFILNNFKDDKYNYIFIIHINRNFNKKTNERINSLPDINPYINQIFIDNLKGNSKITIKDFLNENIKDVLQGKENELNLNEEFNKTLINTFTNELNDKVSNDNEINKYIDELKEFMNEEDEIKNKIIEIAYKLIENNKDEDKNCNVLIDTIIGEGYVNKYTIDIVSCLIEYIKENIFNSYIKKVLLKLEDNNMITTVIELKRNNFKEIDKSIMREIIIKYLDEISEEKNKTKPEPKFLYNYNVPGLYNFYKDISDYICKNITSNYFNNEKKIRDSLKFEVTDISKFHETEDSSLANVEKYINENHKLISEILNKISHNLIFKDYITYYLQKNRNSYDIYQKDDIYHKLIELLLKLRFKDENISLLMKMIWIESNVNYILSILKIFEIAMLIFEDENKLYNKIEELIKENKIKYITNEKKNPEHTKEVNECYYILLASICYIITSDDIKLTKSSTDKKINLINIHHYSSILTDINKILQTLNDDLLIFLNEMYIIDELIKIIDLFINKNNIEKINEIKNLMRKNALIIQKYSNNEINTSDDLPNNIEAIYNLIMEDETIDKKDRDYKDFYDKLRYILYKETKKINNINYRYKILEKLLNSDEMIKKSNDIFQLLLKKNYVKKEYTENRNNILNGDDNIIILLDSKVNKNNFVLVETLLYFFEKNSLNYLNNIINSKKEIKKDNKKQTVLIKLEDEPLDILKECYKVLDYYIFEPKKLDKKLKEICILFCLGYIKTYIHTFIKTFEDKETKFKESKKIIEFINGDNSIYKMIRIFIYKILYNNFGADVFTNEEMVKKYKLKDYKDFKDFIQTNELNKLYKIEYQIRTLKDKNYLQSYELIEKHKKDGFKNTIKKREFDIEDIGFDNFFITSYNLILSDLQMDNSFGNDKFYENICKPLFKEDKLLLKAIQLFYDPTKYRENKNNFRINSNNIKPLLVGYRYCLNELSSQNKNGIYYPLYDSDYASYLTGYFYPGNDTKPNNVYSNVINHFKTKPNEGCYVCLCSKGGFYHSVKSGFPGRTHLNMTCPKCSKNIGTTKIGYYKSEQVIVKREGYYRILKDEKEYKEINKDTDGKKKLKEINYMTLDEYIQKYITNDKNHNEKGVYIYTDKNYFKNDNKIVRNLSQITFRILNYILYSHLFFARLVTRKNDFDKYLPRGMSWVETLNECWNILKNQLLKENIDSIEKFMSYIFIDLFPILNEEKSIDKFDSLIKIEDKLESKIKEIIEEYKAGIIEKKLNSNKNDEDKNSFISLLKETYVSSEYEKDKYPFYEYFYYTDYLNEEYINKKLKEKDENIYPVLQLYLNSKYNKEDKDSYSLVNLNLFNNVLNLINEEYSNKIPREYAEKHKLKDLEIYEKNLELINEFINLYNKLPKEANDKNLSISISNNLSDFLLDDNNKFGNSYKKIYIKFAKEQNQKLENLLDIKIEKGIFEQNCKNRINIQQVNEKEIFTMILPKKVSFMNILFDSSYRKILDSEVKSNELYKEYEINFDLIEENLTESLLKNKKLLNEDINTISSFIYNNEVFNNQVTDLITLFNKRYNHKPIDLYNQVDIYKFSKDNQNSNLCKDIINDFITLIKYLNDKRKEKDNENIIIDKTKENNKENKENDFKITEETKIYDVVNQLKDSFSNNFIKIFENKDNLTIDKTSDIFTYYLKLIFELVMDELKDYQDKKLDDESKTKIDNYSEKDHPIKKEDFACAIRLFTTLVLFLEKEKEDKEKKIKNNRNNIVNYLKASDFWRDIYDHPDFNKNLNELRDINAKISQIIPLYEALGKDIKDTDYDDVRTQIEKENEKSVHSEREDEPDDNNIEIDDDDEDDEFGKKSDDDNDRDD